MFFKGEERGKLKITQNLIHSTVLDNTTISQLTELDIEVIKKLRSDAHLLPKDEGTAENNREKRGSVILIV